MFKVIQVVETKTLRALFDNETKVIGYYDTMLDVINAVGEMLKYCTIKKIDKK